MTLKAFKYRIYPNSEQVELINQHFGHARYIFNWSLALRQRYYRMFGKTLSKRHIQDRLVWKKDQDKWSWLKDVNSQSLLASLMHMDTAYANFFRGNTAFPRFKSKYSGWQSFQAPQHAKVDFDDNAIHLPKLKWVKARLHRQFEGKVKTVTLKRSPSGKFYASVLVETTDAIPEKDTVSEDRTVGIDLGLNKFATFDNGDVVDNPKFLNHQLATLRRQQRILSRKKKGSGNYARQKRLVARFHERVANARENFNHQVTSHLADKNHATTIVLEDLMVKGMVRNKKLARHISDTAWGQFRRFMEYKTEWSGKNLVFIDRFYPSSKTCSSCGHIDRSLLLEDRTYDCPACDLALDRDHNAAINIKREGLRLLLEPAGIAGSVKSTLKTIPVQPGVLAKGSRTLSGYGSDEAPTIAPLGV
jgi:putative transposase